MFGKLHVLLQCDSERWSLVEIRPEKTSRLFRELDFFLNGRKLSSSKYKNHVVRFTF